MKRFFFTSCVILLISLFFPNTLIAWGKKDKKKVPNAQETAKKALAAAEKHLKKGIALRGKGKNDLALVELKKAIEIDPSAAEAYLVLAEIYDDLQIPDKIVECLESGVQLAADQNIEPEKLGRAYCQLAKSHLALGKPDLASADITRAIEQLPDDPAPKKILADIQIERGQIDAGFQSYREALKLEPANAGYWWDFGMAAIHNKKLPAMQEAFLGLSKVDPIKAADFEQLMKGSKVKALKTELATPVVGSGTTSPAVEPQAAATATVPVAGVASNPKPLVENKTGEPKPETASKAVSTESKPIKPVEKPPAGETKPPAATSTEPAVDDPYAIDSAPPESSEGSEESGD